MSKLHKLFSEADITIGHNVEEFDDKMSFTDFIKHGLPPPPPHKTVDTLKFARHKFKFNSNRLDDLGAFLGLGRKMKHEGIGLWIGCMDGDKDCWNRMKAYNAKDVDLLERVYMTLRPWMTRHPDMNAFDSLDACPVCKSRNVVHKGRLLTVCGSKARVRCKNCGKWSSGALKKLPPPMLKRVPGKVWKYT